MRDSLGVGGGPYAGEATAGTAHHSATAAAIPSATRTGRDRRGSRSRVVDRAPAATPSLAGRAAYADDGLRWTSLWDRLAYA